MRNAILIIFKIKYIKVKLSDFDALVVPRFVKGRSFTFELSFKTTDVDDQKNLNYLTNDENVIC